MKCLAKDRNNNGCRNYYQPGSRFCKNHQYMNDYTEAMLEQTRLCSGCKKMYYLEPGINQCSTCHSRGTANREKCAPHQLSCRAGNPDVLIQNPPTMRIADSIRFACLWTNVRMPARDLVPSTCADVVSSCRRTT